jgi:acyl-homoserine-lactone acylase
MINSRIGGSDGLGSAKFDLATLQSSFMTNRNLSGELGRDALVGLCRSQPVLTATDGSSVSVGDACDVLAGWNLKGDTDSRGAVLWRLFWFNASTVTGLFSVAFDPQNPTTTPNTLNTSDSAVRRAFADAVQTMNALPLDLDVPLGAVQHTTIGGPRVAMPGCTEQEGCYNIACVTTICGFGPDAQGNFAPIDYGTSFLMAVEFQQGGPKSRTILTYSESQNPASPHHNDQTLLYSAEKWVTGRYTEEEIAGDPKLVVRAIAGY